MSTKDIDWGVQGCTTGHYYRVDAVRHSARPEYGPTPFSSDIRQKTFQFGKGKEFKTGKEAFAAATDFAVSIVKEASTLYIARMNNSSGIGQYLKNDNDLMFDTGWE